MVELRVHGLEHVAAISDCILGLLILVSNSVLVAAFVRKKELHKKEFVLIGGIAVFDLAYGLSSVCTGLHKHFSLTTGHTYSNISVEYLFVANARHIYPVANLGYLCLSIDRVMAVIWFQSYLKLQHDYVYRMLAACASYGVITFIYAVYMALVARTYEPFTQIAGGVVTMITAYSSVILYFVVCVGHRRMISNGTGANERQLQRQKRLNETVGVLVLFTMLFDALPLTLVVLVPGLGNWRFIGYSLTRVNCFVNTFVIYWRQQDVRNSINQMFCKQTAVQPTRQAGKGVPRARQAQRQVAKTTNF